MVKRASWLNRSAYWCFLILWILLASSCASKQFYRFASLSNNLNGSSALIDSVGREKVLSNYAMPEQYASADSSLPFLPATPSIYSVSQPLYVQKELSKELNTGRTYLKLHKHASKLKKLVQPEKHRVAAIRQDKLPILGKATVGFWLGVASLLMTITALAVLNSTMAFLPFIGSVALALTGGVVSYIAIRRIKAQPEKFGGLKRARAGFTFSFLTIITWVILFLLILAIISSWGY